MVIESCGNGSPHVSNCYRYKPYGAPSRNRTGTPAINEAADFKSAVSTYFTIGAACSKAVKTVKTVLHVQIHASG